MPSFQTLSSESERKHGFTHVLELDYTDLTAAALTQTWSMGVPAGSVLRNVEVHVLSQGVHANALQVDIGDTGDPNRFHAVASSNLEDATGTTIFPLAVTPHDYLTADTLSVIVTSTVTNVNAATAGRWLFLVTLTDLRQLASTKPGS